MRNFWVGVIVLVAIIACVLFQVNVLNLIPLFGVIANIGIVFVVSLGILCGQKIGVTIGILYGVFLDILFGKSLGIYTLLFFVIGFLCGKISYNFSKENKSSIVMISALVTFAYEFVCYLIFKFIYGYEYMFLTTSFRILLECFYNIFIAMIFYRPFSSLADIINKSKSSYYLL